MHDLRKQALLESGKTVSRKARSKTGTPSASKTGSPLPSRSGSRVASRSASDDEGDLSDGTSWSATNSIDEMLAGAEIEHDTKGDAWVAELYERMDQICDRKKSSAQSREEALSVFNILLMRHYAQTHVKSKIDDLLAALLKSIKAGSTEREVVLALRSLALVLITVPEETVYDAVQATVKSTVSDSEYENAKLSGIHTLGIITFYGGASTEETEDTMDYLLEVASSDGAMIGEEDNATIVTAALEEWGFLATQLDDMEDSSETAMETFVDQLDSSDAGVQIAAGENIALLYEKSYTEAESDDEKHDGDDDEDDEDDDRHGPRMIKRYDAYRQRHLLEQKLEQLTKASSKRVSKKDRKAIHTAFNDVLNTIEKPTRGPRYSTALDEDGREFGSRMKVAVHGGGRMLIDTWSKLLRLNALKRLLQGGFMVHYEHNEVVFDSLPVIVEDE